MKNINQSIEMIIRDNMTEGMLQIDGHGRILFVNASALKILELEQSQLIGKKIGLLFLDSEQNDDFVQLILNAFMIPEKHHQSVVTIKTAAKIKYLKAASQSEILFDEEKNHTLLVTVCFQDISEYVEKSRLQEEISRLNKLNSSLRIRNKLIRKIFGCFILRDEEFETFLSTDRIKKLNQGFQKNITVIQSDLRGYTAMSFRLTTEDLIAVMNYYISKMSEVILDHHGMIVEILGDGILSAFGTLGHEDTQCEDAIAAAVEMQQKMRGINTWIQRHHYDTYLKMGIGIDCGPAILGFAGNGDLRIFDIMGEVSSKADKIQNNTVEGDVLISQRVKDNISSELEIGKILEVPVDKTGKTEQVCQVKGIGSPYHLKCPVIKTKRVPLKKPVQSRCFVFSGKVRENSPIEFEITEISDRDMKIRMDRNLPVLTNINMDIGEALDGKIVEKITENTYIVSFTSRPNGFSRWKENLLNSDRVLKN